MPESKRHRIIWLPEAVQDIARLKDFIYPKNRNASRRAANRIQEVVRILENNPEAGRPVLGLAGFRDQIIPFGAGAYVLRYRHNAEIAIVRVWHSKEDRAH